MYMYIAIHLILNRNNKHNCVLLRISNTELKRNENPPGAHYMLILNKYLNFSNSGLVRLSIEKS